MKSLKVLIVLTVLISLITTNTIAQTPYHYRPAPKTGEWIALAGIAMVATASFINQSSDNSTTGKVMNMAGYATMMAGVSIDLYQRPAGYKQKYHHRRPWYKRVHLKGGRRR